MTLHRALRISSSPQKIPPKHEFSKANWSGCTVTCSIPSILGFTPHQITLDFLFMIPSHLFFPNGFPSPLSSKPTLYRLLFAGDICDEACVSLQILFQVDLGFPFKSPATYALTVSYSSPVTRSCFHFLYACFLCLILVSSNLFIHAAFLPHLFMFLLSKSDQSEGGQFLRISQISCSPFLSWKSSQGILPSRSLHRPKSALESTVLILFVRLPFPRILNSTITSQDSPQSLYLISSFTRNQVHKGVFSCQLIHPMTW